MLPPLPRVARHRSLIVTVGVGPRQWRHLVLPPGAAARLDGFADVQALSRDIVALGVAHTALALCRTDGSLAVIALDPPDDDLRGVADLAHAEGAVEVVVFEVGPAEPPVPCVDNLTCHEVNLQLHGLEVVDVVVTDGDVVLSAALALGRPDPYSRLRVRKLQKVSPSE